MSDEVIPTPGGEPTAPAVIPPAPAAPTTPVAPEVPPVITAPVVPEVPATDEPVFAPSGNATLDLVFAFLGSNGMRPDSPEVQAAGAGDFTALEAALKAKGVKGYEQYLAVGKNLYEQNVQEATAKAAADKTAILALVGGEQAWTDIRTWVGANAEEAERDSINAAFQQGGLHAKAMAAYLKGLYERSPDFVSKGRQARSDDAGTGSTPASGALSPEQYKTAVAELVASLRGKALESSPMYRELQARRQAYRG
jgi:hypothetical protein